MSGGHAHVGTYSPLSLPVLSEPQGTSSGPGTTCCEAVLPWASAWGPVPTLRFACPLSLGHLGMSGCPVQERLMASAVEHLKTPHPPGDVCSQSTTIADS